MITVVIRGPQGSGKTTLAHALYEMLLECDIDVRLDESEHPVQEDADFLLRHLNLSDPMVVRIETKVAP